MKLPSKNLHLMFDDCLRRRGVIGNEDFSDLHDMLESDFSKKDRERFENYNIDVEMVKGWILLRYSARNKESLDSYLRAAIGHLLLEVVWFNFSFSREYTLMKAAFESFESQYENVSFEQESQLCIT